MFLHIKKLTLRVESLGHVTPPRMLGGSRWGGWPRCGWPRQRQPASPLLRARFGRYLYWIFIVFLFNGINLLSITIGLADHVPSFTMFNSNAHTHMTVIMLSRIIVIFQHFYITKIAGRGLGCSPILPIGGCFAAIFPGCPARFYPMTCCLRLCWGFYHGSENTQTRTGLSWWQGNIISDSLITETRRPWVAHLRKRSKVTVEPIIENPRGIIWTTLVEHLLMLLYTKYESSGPCSFRQEDFLKFHFKNLFIDPVTYLCNQQERFEQLW